MSMIFRICLSGCHAFLSRFSQWRSGNRQDVPQLMRIVSMLLMASCLWSCDKQGEQTKQPVYQDVAFQQDYSIKYNITDTSAALRRVVTDRNGVIGVLSSKGLLKLYAGEFLYPGSLVPDRTYRPIADKK